VEYKKTLNLPHTDFPMRANLPQREPELLDFWKKIGLDQLICEQSRGKPKYILHDGPPYANGHLHLGHVLNKVLKDIIIRYRTMAGYDVPYVPGWDTHGLPIEQQVIKTMKVDRHKLGAVKFRRLCRDYALKYVDIQRKEFQRLGVTGNWQDPYLTLKPAYEAVQIGLFGKMAEKGFIYKGLKPVYWCVDCETALAEAEVEYQEDESESIYVLFPVKDSKGVFDADEETYILIWTTTPWTIPGNMAISVHPDYQYVLAEVDGKKLVVAKEFLDKVAAIKGVTNPRILGSWPGRRLEGIRCTHPFYDRDSLVILGTHVTLEQGTGAVHTAPAHGIEDFEACQKYGIPVLSLVDGQGKFLPEAGMFAGMKVWESNERVIQELEGRGLLYHREKMLHQYPHCWRCKDPLIFRATEQWFASIDGFRREALRAIDEVQWIPSWGRERIHNMISERSDWCVSRQRVWGVPIPIFYCEGCDAAIINEQTIGHLQGLFAEHGSDVWFERSAAELLPAGFRCPSCGGESFSRETDIMDVWFDSGSSHMAVLEQRPELRWPADLYLEGSDQHRGWFNSSLCTSVAVRGTAPYKAVLTHGFLVDEEGRKMSKSLGNTIYPQEMIDKYGADVLRLWVTSADYRNDMAVSKKIMGQLADTYRKIRNTFRFILGNLYDFHPEKDSLAYDELSLVDRWLLYRLHQLIQRVNKAYEQSEFHIVYHAISSFCVVDLSSFYLDITKDTLYCSASGEHSRRSIQTVLLEAGSVLARLLAPVIPFTTEEVWGYLPGAKEAAASVHLTALPQAKRDYLNPDLEKLWDKILSLRDEAARALEAARREKVIGPGTQANVSLYPEDEETLLFLRQVEDELPRILIVSGVKVHQVWEAAPQSAWKPENGLHLRIGVFPARGAKCARCWLYKDSVGQFASYPDLCERCHEVVRRCAEESEED
jgi:isoleucyl-tRNA synthetase